MATQLQQMLADSTTEARSIPINRVLVNAEGETINVERARQRGIESVDVVLIRSDDWVLACSWDLRNEAESLWPSEWRSIAQLNPPRRL